MIFADPPSHFSSFPPQPPSFSGNLFYRRRRRRRRPSDRPKRTPSPPCNTEYLGNEESAAEQETGGGKEGEGDDACTTFLRLLRKRCLFQVGCGWYAAERTKRWNIELSSSDPHIKRLKIPLLLGCVIEATPQEIAINERKESSSPKTSHPPPSNAPTP